MEIPKNVKKEPGKKERISTTLKGSAFKRDQALVLCVNED